MNLLFSKKKPLIHQKKKYRISINILSVPTKKQPADRKYILSAGVDNFD
jgi:hypothetical protein